LNHANYNCIATDAQGAEHKIYANWLHNENLDNWQGWHCEVGVTRLYLDANGTVYDGECKNSVLGHIDHDWQLATDTVCSRTRCTGCTDDLIARKYR